MYVKMSDVTFSDKRPTFTEQCVCVCVIPGMMTNTIYKYLKEND